MNASPGKRPRRNVVAVGAVVVSESGILLVRMTYGPSKGRYMLPGGHLDAGERLDEAVVREVEEETGVVAKIVGICGLRTRFDGDISDTYVLFSMVATSGSPRSDGHENDDAKWFTNAELDDECVTDLSAYFGRLALEQQLTTMAFADDHDWEMGGRDIASWRLFR